VRQRSQAGITTVEFAIIGLVAMIVLLAVLEFSRLLFVANALNEATRRGARMATVCPLNDPAIAQVAVFNAPGGGGASPVVSGLGAGNVSVQYLDAAGGTTGTFADIRYVRVSIVNFQHTLIVPVFGTTFTMQGYPTTLPRESLGIPRVGAGPLPC
jgi:Flp pilus assembly protein TadG